MSASLRNWQTLKNFSSTALPFLGVTLPKANQLLFASLGLLIALTELPQETQAQDSPQWRRTKDGWVDLAYELRLEPSLPQRNLTSKWGPIWPAAATLCLGASAYWLLTFDRGGRIREKAKNFSKNHLGRFIRQSAFFPENRAEFNQAMPVPVRANAGPEFPQKTHP